MRPDGLLLTGRYTLLKKSEQGTQIIVACKRCRTLTNVRTAKQPTYVRAKGKAKDADK
jgi:phage FluMu protein Com